MDLSNHLENPFPVWPVNQITRLITNMTFKNDLANRALSDVVKRAADTLSGVTKDKIRSVAFTGALASGFGKTGHKWFRMNNLRLRVFKYGHGPPLIQQYGPCLSRHPMDWTIWFPTICGS